MVDYYSAITSDLSLPDMIWLPNGVYLGPVMTCKGSGGRNISGSWNTTSAILTMSLTSSRGDFIVPTSNH